VKCYCNMKSRIIMDPPIKTTCLVQLMFGKPLDKSGNHLGYCPSQTFQTCSFLKLSFANKDLDAIDLGNILYHKSVKYKIPSYCKDKSAPINSMGNVHSHDINL
jgi:hypothetical protein